MVPGKSGATARVTGPIVPNPARLLLCPRLRRRGFPLERSDCRGSTGNFALYRGFGASCRSYSLGPGMVMGKLSAQGLTFRPLSETGWKSELNHGYTTNFSWDWRFAIDKRGSVILAVMRRLGAPAWTSW